MASKNEILGKKYFERRAILFPKNILTHIAIFQHAQSGSRAKQNAAD